MDISTIIPVYNASDTLERCIESLLAAQVSEIKNEIILINDGSTDDSKKICKEYAERFKNISFFSQPNQGPSAARNLGLQHAEGNWISFVDSDDFVKKSYFKHYLKYLNQENDLIIGGLLKVNNQSEVIRGGFVFPKKMVKANNHKNFLFDFPLFNYAFPVAKLYKKKILDKHHIRFPEGVKMYEDSIFIMEYLQYCHQIIFKDTQDYYYVERPNSLTTQIHSFFSEYQAAHRLYRQARDIYGLSNKDLMSEYRFLGKRISNSLNRAVISLFRNEYSKTEILIFLKEVDDNCIELYAHYHHPKHWAKIIIKDLFVKKKFKKLYYFGRLAYQFT